MSTHAPAPETTTIESVTPEWLTLALRAAGRLGETDAVIEIAAERAGAGQMSRISRLAATYEDGGDDAPRTLMAKYASADTQSREFGRAAGFHARETRFYAELASDLAVRTPEVYYAALAPDESEFLILFEDLAPARELDQVTGCSAGEALLAVQQVAHLHGESWERPELGAHDWLRSGAAMWQMAAGQVGPMFAAFLERYEDQLDGEILAAGEKLVDEAASWSALLERPRCLWHADFRLDNLFFDAKAGAVPLAVFDWQTVTLGPPAVDVAYFLGGGLDPAERRAHEEDLVRAYHDGLLAHGVENYPWDDCWLDYRAHAVSGFLAALLGAAQGERTERGDRLLVTMAQRHGRHVLDLDAFDALRCLSA